MGFTSGEFAGASIFTNLSELFSSNWRYVHQNLKEVMIPPILLFVQSRKLKEQNQ